MQLTEVYPRIFHVESDAQAPLANLFLRFQEHYESPRFRGQVFSCEEFHAWYTAEKGSSYDADWSGFNVPHQALRPFLEGAFDPLTEAESWLLSHFQDRPGPYYIVGSLSGDRATYLHELSHALYALNERYRFTAQEILKIAETKDLRDHLVDLGYAENVLTDECHAYLIADFDDLKEQGVRVNHLFYVSQRLRANFASYLPDMGVFKL